MSSIEDILKIDARTRARAPKQNIFPRNHNFAKIAPICTKLKILDNLYIKLKKEIFV
jgi:hypothetical protein